MVLKGTYQGYEVSFCQKRRRLSGPLVEVDGGGFELANAFVVQDLLVRPLLVDVDFQIVALKNRETVTGELKSRGDLAFERTRGSLARVRIPATERSLYTLSNFFFQEIQHLKTDETDVNGKKTCGF